MKFVLEVNQQTCIRCGKCVRVCPADIFSLPPADAKAQVNHPEWCIFCGHCVSVCPTDAVIHSDFPPARVHTIDREDLPSPEQVLELIRSRRTNRTFSKKSIPQGYLDLIVEAAHRAPTAANMQGVNFTLVTDPKILREICLLTLDTFDALVKKINRPVIKSLVKRFKPDIYANVPKLEALRKAFEAGGDPVLRGATAALFIHSPKSSRFGCADCNLAYQNASLMAESLGVSQVYTGFVCTAIAQDPKKRINKLLGTDEVIHAGMGLGMPAFLYPKYPDRKPLKLHKIGE